MIPIPSAFAPSYAKARVRFLEAAATVGARIESHDHPLPGREGERLALDVALDGTGQAERLLIVSSACHGVEGFHGSGVQVFALHDTDWRAHAREAGVDVLYLHALDPYGFSHLRRVTHENVDLSRNVGAPPPVNEAYRRAHPLLLPAAWPPDAAGRAALREVVAREGLDAIAAGQGEFPEGLFYAGQAPAWSHLALRQVLARHAAARRQVHWIDLGAGTLPGGPIWRALPTPCTGIAVDHPATDAAEALEAQCGDHWLALHPLAEPALAASIQARLRAAFYADTDAWKGQAISQARQAMFQAIA